jgi:hypothetical protein
MTLLALLLALAQQGGQPTTTDQPGVTQPSPTHEKPEAATSSNTSDKAESLPREHPTELQGKPVKKAKSKRQARANKPLPPAHTPSGAEEAAKASSTKNERDGGKGKPAQPKPIGEKTDQ